MTCRILILWALCFCVPRFVFGELTAETVRETTPTRDPLPPPERRFDSTYHDLVRLEGVKRADAIKKHLDNESLALRDRIDFCVGYVRYLDRMALGRERVIPKEGKAPRVLPLKDSKLLSMFLISLLLGIERTKAIPTKSKLEILQDMEKIWGEEFDVGEEIHASMRTIQNRIGFRNNSVQMVADICKDAPALFRKLKKLWIPPTN